TLGTFKVEATQVGAAFSGAKPRLAVHWPCRLPVTKSGPKVCVGGGVFPWHCKFPPTETRLMSEAALELLRWTWTLPWTSPRSAWQPPPLLMHSNPPPILTPGPINPLGCAHCLIWTLALTVTPPS